MGRAPRVDVRNEVYHIVNRANSRKTIFNTPDEYRHFEMILKIAVEKFNMRLLAVLKYIERNPVRAKLVRTVEAWRWGSGYRRIRGSKKEQALLAELPTDLPRNYRVWVNQADKEDNLNEIRTSVIKGKPLGTMGWVERMVERFDLTATMRGRGRPKA